MYKKGLHAQSPQYLWSLSDTAVAIVGKDSGRWVIDVAAFPFLVRHPIVYNHLALSRVELFENLPVEERLLGEGLRVCIEMSSLLKLFVTVFLLCVLFQVINH